MVRSCGRGNGFLVEHEEPAECRLDGGVLWEEPGVVDIVGDTCTTPAECGLGGEVLWDRHSVNDRAVGTSTTPAE